MADLRKELIEAKNDMDLEVKAAIQKFHNDTGLRITGVHISQNRDGDGLAYGVNVEVKI